MKQKLWFKRRNFGYGWYPNSIEGWIIVLSYLIFVMSGTFFFSKNPEGKNSVIFLSIVFLLTSALILISYKKGEKPMWMWAGKPIFKKKK